MSQYITKAGKLRKLEKAIYPAFSSYETVFRDLIKHLFRKMTVDHWKVNSIDCDSQSSNLIAC